MCLYNWPPQNNHLISLLIMHIENNTEVDKHKVKRLVGLVGGQETQIAVNLFANRAS